MRVYNNNVNESILSFQDAFETDNEIVAVTEYVATGDLHKLFEIYKVSNYPRLVV